MSDGTTGEHVTAQEPRDGVADRPRPQYGEYAPPGWVSPVQPVAAAEPEAPAGGAAPSASAAAAPRRPRSRADRIVTALLLGLGAYNVFLALVRAPAFATTMLGTLRDLGYPVDEFDGQDALQRVGILSAVLAVSLYVLAVVLSRRRLAVGKLAFWVPLVAGVVFTLVQSVAFLAVVFGDPSFVQALQDMPTMPSILPSR